MCRLVYGRQIQGFGCCREMCNSTAGSGGQEEEIITNSQNFTS